MTLREIFVRINETSNQYEGGICSLLVTYLVYSRTMKIKAVCSTEM
jgi:hypothetical protein